MCAWDPVLKSNNKVYLTFMTRDGADNAATHPKLLWYINVNSQAYYHGHNLPNPTPTGCVAKNFTLLLGINLAAV